MKKTGLFFVLVITLFGLLATGCQQTPTPLLEAQKAGDISINLMGSTTYPSARGRATYGVRAIGPILTVRTRNVLSLAGQTLDVFLDSTTIGSATVDSSLGDATLVVRPLPQPAHSGSVVEVKTAAGILVVSGTFTSIP